MAKKRKSAATSLDEVDRTMYASFCSAANSLSQLYTQAMNHQKLSFQAGERQGLGTISKPVVPPFVPICQFPYLDYNLHTPLLMYNKACCHGRYHAPLVLWSPPTSLAGSLCWERATQPYMQLHTPLCLCFYQCEEKLYQWIRRQQEEGSRVTTVDILNYIQNELDYCGEEPSMSPRVPVQHQYSQPVTNFMNSGFPISSGSSCPTTAVQGIRSEHCDQQSKNSVFSNALSSPVRQSLQHYHITRGGYCPNGGLPLGNGARNNEPTIINNQSRDSSALSLSSNDSAMDMHADSPAHEFIY
ncbi:hypothetical protein SO802_002800 [Lithocarpus litseifolius]|uniref:Uncharacterized protein n=1 Tax=Lithocarpus litseifolius TaxID=425828 RepID=A0AAW2DZ57_9ROSI